MMSTQSRKTGPEFFVGDQSAENMRRKFIDAPLEAAQQSMLNSSLEIANLLSILPDAFLSSQQRELERVKKSGKEKDPRIEILQTSIEQASALKTTVKRGQARAGRALASLADTVSVFHGFVSDAEFAPLMGLTVRLVESGKTRGAKTLSDTTDQDGYFRIALDPNSDARQESKTKGGQINMSERIAGLFKDFMNAPSFAESSDDSQVDGQVEILKKGKVIYHDPVPVPRDQGSVYREYVIVADKALSVPDFHDFMAGRQHEAHETPIDSSKPAAETSQAGATMSSTTSDDKAKSSSEKASKKSQSDAGSSKGKAKKGSSIRSRKR